MEINFHGTFGELNSCLREIAINKSPSRLAEIFPDTDRLYPSFFYEQIPELQKELSNLYPDLPFSEKDEKGLENFNKHLRELSGGLRSIRSIIENPKTKVSRTGMGFQSNLNKEIQKKVADFNEALVGYDFLRCHEIKPDNKKIARFDFKFPLTISEPDDPKELSGLNKLIFYADFIYQSATGYARKGKGRRYVYVKHGPPPKQFNVLIFYVVTRFSHFVRDKKGNLVKRDGKICQKRNWQLIIAALLWLHALEGIPEIKTFNEDHEDMEVNQAIKRLKCLVERQYRHFRESGKGRGKWGGWFQTEDDFLNYKPGWL